MPPAPRLLVCLLCLADTQCGDYEYFRDLEAPQQQHRRQRGNAIASETVSYMVAWPTLACSVETRGIVGASPDLSLNPGVGDPILRWLVISSSLCDSDSGGGGGTGGPVSPCRRRLRPYKPNTRLPFWCLSRQSRCTCGISTWRRLALFVCPTRPLSGPRQSIRRSVRATCARLHSSGDLRRESGKLI